MVRFPSPIAHITNPAGIPTYQTTLHRRKYYRAITLFGRIKDLSEDLATLEAVGTHSSCRQVLPRHSRALTWHDNDSLRYPPSRLSSLRVTPIMIRWKRCPPLPRGLQDQILLEFKRHHCFRRDPDFFPFGQDFAARTRRSTDDSADSRALSVTGNRPD